MNFTKFLEDNNIEYLTEGHKHCRPGWVNIKCPFCTGHEGYHLGYDLHKNYFHCWRCGGHSVLQTIQKLTGTSKSEALQIISQYKGYSPLPKTAVRQVKRKRFRYPSGTAELGEKHRKYLESRNFDPNKLQQEWGLLGAGPVALLDDIDYKFRVLAPIQYRGKVVSFQARDVTERAKMKYLACPKPREVIHHKQILYGIDKCKKDAVALVEGITDVWRLGPGAVACFGISWKMAQAALLAQRFQRIFILFDDDPQAKQQASALEAELAFRGKEVEIEYIQGDPGDMPQEEANYLMSQLIGQG